MTMNVPTMKAEIISTLDVLPPESLELLFDFVVLLHKRSKQSQKLALKIDLIDHLLDSPIEITDFQPLTRKEIYD